MIQLLTLMAEWKDFLGKHYNKFEEDFSPDEYDWFERGDYNPHRIITPVDINFVKPYLTRHHAIKYYNKELELHPTNVNLYYCKGAALYENRDFNLALECFNKGLELDSGPKDFRNSKYLKAMNYKGCTLLELGKIEPAIDVFNNALALNPEFIDTWINKGCALRELGKDTSAIECYDKALELDYDNKFTWYHKGIALYYLDILKEANRCFNKTLELDPKYIVTWRYKGLVFYGRGKFQDAIYCYNKVLALYPKAYIVWNQKGEVFNTLGKLEEALESFDNALKWDPEYVDAWKNKAYTLRKLGNLEEAIECYDKVVKINPNDNFAILNRKVVRAQILKPDIVVELNEFITLKLSNTITLLYLNNEYFAQCMRLYINIPLKDVVQYDSINSIDEAAEIYEKTLMYGELFQGEHGIEPLKTTPQIRPEEEFWAHRSNMQAWIENDYDTRILHSNIAFPLLKALSDAGDRVARRVFKDEIAERFSSGYKAVMVYLIIEGYLNHLTESEKITLYESVGFDKLIKTFKDDEDPDIVEFCKTIRIFKKNLYS